MDELSKAFEIPGAEEGDGLDMDAINAIFQSGDASADPLPFTEETAPEAEAAEAAEQEATAQEESTAAEQQEPATPDKAPKEEQKSEEATGKKPAPPTDTAAEPDITLYAQLRGVTNREAYRDLTGGSNVYQLRPQPAPQKDNEREPASLAKRHAAYTEMLSFLTLSDAHRQNLHGRGLSDERIEQNGYKTMPSTPESRRLLAKLVGANFDLKGIPGFYTRYGDWTLAGPDGFLIPVRNKEGLIQGIKIRLDDEADPERKYRWLSSRSKKLRNGSRSYGEAADAMGITIRTARRLKAAALEKLCEMYSFAGCMK